MNEQIEKLKEKGFKGFKTVKELRTSLVTVPEVKGVYVVIRDKESKPEFLEHGTGGFFKKKNPNISMEKLKDYWVDGTPIVYIGQTERELKKRIEELIRLGQGKAVAHWGGRIMWQLKDADELIIAWKELPDSDPKEVERNLLIDFKSIYCKLPFANLR